MPASVIPSGLIVIAELRVLPARRIGLDSHPADLDAWQGVRVSCGAGKAKTVNGRDPRMTGLEICQSLIMHDLPK